MDYLAAGLPVVTTDGDAMADLVRATGCGIVVPPHDPDALARALAGLADDAVTRRTMADRAAAAAAELAWDVVAAPLVAFTGRRIAHPTWWHRTTCVRCWRSTGAVRCAASAPAIAEGGPALLADRVLRRLKIRGGSADG